MKKVRKRFEILEITKVNDTSLWHYSYDSIYPYYLLIDNDNPFASFKFLTYNDTIEILIYLMRKEYFKYSKKSRMIYKKVWYKNGK